MPGWYPVGRARRVCSLTTTCTCTARGTPTSPTPSASAIASPELDLPARRSGRTRPTMTRLRRPLLAAVFGCLAVVGWATPAAAHAAVTASSPTQGEHVPRIPHTVTINFDQPVQPDDGGLVVLNSTGQHVQVASGHPSPATLNATLPASLGSGAYVADYTVTSVDGHVLSRGIVFLVGHVRAGAIGGLTARPRTSFTNWVDDFGQFMLYLGVFVASGLAFFLAFILQGGEERFRLRRVI